MTHGYDKAVQICFDKLLDAVTDVDAPDCRGHTSLYLVRNAWLARILLEAGAELPRETILRRHVSIDEYRLLINHIKNHDLGYRQVEYHTEGAPALTALLMALAHHHWRLALELLEPGARADAVDDDYNGAFHYPASNFATIPDCDALRPESYFFPSPDPEWAELTVSDFSGLLCHLRDAGADILARNKHQHSGLHVIVAGRGSERAWNFSTEAVGAVLAAGADLERGTAGDERHFCCGPTYRPDRVSTLPKVWRYYYGRARIRL